VGVEVVKLANILVLQLDVRLYLAPLS
jgi:hypothetical protein